MPQGDGNRQVLADRDVRRLRNALGRFATGVAIVTACSPQGGNIGLTINSFSSVSLNPPLVLWSLDQRSSYYEAFRDIRRYCINVLNLQQHRLAVDFAGRQGRIFGPQDWEMEAGSPPRLKQAAVRFECVPYAAYPTGDHTVHIARLIDFAASDAEALVFCDGRFTQLALQRAAV